MTTRTSRTRARVGALLATTTLTLGALAVTDTAAQAAVAAPTPKATYVASKGVALSWKETGQDAYRLRMSTSSSMKSPDSFDVLGNYFEWTRTDASAAARAPRLTPGKTYYFQVKAITRAADGGDRENITAYSKAVGITLPKTALPELQPTGVKATPAGADSMHVSWRSRGPGVGYVLRYTSTPSLTVTKWKSIKTDTSGATIKGLVGGKKYYFRARVIDTKGVGISPYSYAGPSATTSTTTKSPGLSIASYNVRKMYSEADWTSRRKAVAANITTAAPDVIGLQEAIPTTYAANGRKQWDDLIRLIGSPYSLATSGSGSSGTQLAYNTKRVTLVKSGVKMLHELGSAERYGVWGIFKDKVGGKEFFAISTHLEPGSVTPALNEERKRQASDILALVKANAGGRPTVILGDMNSSRSAEPSNGPYDTFTDAGYVDPLDNAVGSWASGANATAEHIVDAEYSSANKLTKRAPLSSYPIGTHIDYMFVSPQIRVGMWRMVIKLDTTGSFIGTIPSDHNMIQMTVHLP